MEKASALADKLGAKIVYSAGGVSYLIDNVGCPFALDIIEVVDEKRNRRDVFRLDEIKDSTARAAVADAMARRWSDKSYMEALKFGFNVEYGGKR